MDLQQLADIETELDMSIDSSAAWLEQFIEREDLSDEDYETIITIVDNLYEAADYIRAELGIGGEEEDLEEDEEDEEEDCDSHLPCLLEDEEEDTLTFKGTWDSIRFLEDENGEVTGIQVDFV
jgi:hypothetical protein